MVCGTRQINYVKKNSKKILNNNNNNNTPTKLNALLDGSSRSRSRTPFLNFPIWNWFAQIYFFPRDLVLFLFFGVRAQNYVRSKELTVATVVVEYTATNIAARELSRVNTNETGRVVHVVENLQWSQFNWLIGLCCQKSRKSSKAKNPSTGGRSKCIHLPLFLLFLCHHKVH